MNTLVNAANFLMIPLKPACNNLSLRERNTYIPDYGKYIGVGNYYRHAINLHLVGETFYEVWFFIPDNYSVKIEPLDDLKKLDLYINLMNKLENI